MNDSNETMMFHIGDDYTSDEDEKDFSLFEVKIGSEANLNTVDSKWRNKCDPSVLTSVINCNVTSQKPVKPPCSKIIFYIFLVVFGLLHLVLAFALMTDFHVAQKYMFYLILGWILIAYLKVIID